MSALLSPILLAQQVFAVAAIDWASLAPMISALLLVVTAVGLSVAIGRVMLGRSDVFWKLWLAFFSVAFSAVATYTVWPWRDSFYGVVLLLLMATMLSITLSMTLGAWLRMPDLVSKFWLVFFVVLVSGVAMVAGWPPKLGVDLAGGTELVYEVDQSKRPRDAAPLDAKQMQSLIDAINKRVDPSGVKQIVLRAFGDQGIEVIIPETDPAEVAKIMRDIVTTGHLEFRILADPQREDSLARRARSVDWVLKDPDADARRDNPAHEVLVNTAEKSPDDILKIGDRDRARWETVPADKVAEVRANKQLVTREVAGKLEKLVIIGQPLARWVPVGMTDKGVPRIEPSDQIVYRHRDDRKKGAIDVLVLIDKQDVEGKYLTHAQSGYSEDGLCVTFDFDAEGGRRFENLTSANLPNEEGRKRFLGIVLDDELLSDPTLSVVISDRGRITGHFSQEEVDWLAGVLNAGSLPASLTHDPISKQDTLATLGETTIHQGVRSIIISLLAVPLFMMLYYRFAGIVAAVVLMFNLFIVVAVMVALRALFTLPGMAAMVLTVGMAVDANVLIYERIREELDRGAALRMAIRNGYHRAMRTIVDANLSNVIAGVALYTFSHEPQIRGFAVTLILGILTSMFTAIFCSRLVFDVFEKKRWLKKLSMTRILHKTQIDFIGKMKWCITGSLLLIGFGMFGVYLRGTDFLDIDLGGGTKIQMTFRQPQKRDSVESRLTAYSLKLPKVEQLDALTVNEGGTQGKSFIVETTQMDLKVVQKALTETFPGQLLSNHVTFDPHHFQNVTAVKMPDQHGAPGVQRPAPTPGPGPEMILPPEKKEGEKKPAQKPPAAEKPAAKSGAKSGDGAALRAEDAGSQLAAVDPRLFALADPQASASDAAPATALSEKEAAQKTANQKSSDSNAGKQDAAAAVEKQDGPATAPVKKKEGSAASAPKESAVKSSPSPAKNEAPQDNPGKVPKGAKAAAGVASPAGRAGAKEVDGEAELTSDVEVLPDQSEAKFIGGTAARLKFEQDISQDVLKDKIEEAAKQAKLGVDFDVSNPKVVGESRLPESTWLLKVKLDKADTARLLKQLEDLMAGEPTFSVANVRGQVAGVAQLQALAAMLTSFLFIIAYIWFRFQQVRYGVAAIIALIHDTLVTVGLLALSAYVVRLPFVADVLRIEPFKLNLVIVAAIMTLIGYSMNDTVVIFDRIRELRGKSPWVTREIINASVNQTLSRTLLTSFLTFMVVVILYIFGGPGIHGFAFTFIIGIIVGTYSSIYIASPILLWMERGKRTGSSASDRGLERRQPQVAD